MVGKTRGLFGHIVRTVAVVSLLGGTLAGAGCSDTGPYAEAKRDWDATPSDAERHDMRIRLETTQQDH